VATDNTTINPATVSGGDQIRDLARQGGAVKTQVSQIDIGGVAANAENLLTAGQKTSANSIPVVFASDQSPLPITNAAQTTQTDYATGSVTLAADQAFTRLGPMTGVSFGLLRIDAISGCTISIQASFDNVTWSNLAIANIGMPPTVLPIIAVGSYGIAGCSAFPYIRALQNGAGTATVFLRASGASGASFVFSALADAFKTQDNAAANAVAPSYVSGTTNPLSMTTAGALRVDASSTLQPVTQARTTLSDQALTELLLQMNGGIRACVHVLGQILAVSRGLADPAPADEADTLIGEYLDQRSVFTNLTN
jgi:hypothetical protein